MLYGVRLTVLVLEFTAKSLEFVVHSSQGFDRSSERKTGRCRFIVEILEPNV